MTFVYNQKWACPFVGKFLVFAWKHLIGYCSILTLCYPGVKYILTQKSNLISNAIKKSNKRIHAIIRIKQILAKTRPAKTGFKIAAKLLSLRWLV